MSLRVAFAGTGWASRIHAKAALTYDDAALAGAVNHRPQSLQTFADEFGIEGCFATVEELIAAGCADALVISTPNALHAGQAIAALDAGLHVLVEKPMAINASEAAAMLRAATRSGAYLMLAHCFRFDPRIIWLREQIAAGMLGRIIRSKGYGVHVAAGPKGWFVDPTLAGGGALVDMGVHAIDTLRYLHGDPQPKEVWARIGTYYSDHAVDDTGTIMVIWDDGSNSYIESGWWQPHSDGICAASQVYGTKGFGRAFPTEIKVRVSNETHEYRTVEGPPKVMPPQPPRQPPQDVYDRQIARFFDSIKSGERPTPDGETGLVSMRILDAAYESSRTGKAVAC